MCSCDVLCWFRLYFTIFTLTYLLFRSTSVWKIPFDYEKIESKPWANHEEKRKNIENNEHDHSQNIQYSGPSTHTHTHTFVAVNVLATWDREEEKNENRNCISIFNCPKCVYFTLEVNRFKSSFISTFVRSFFCFLQCTDGKCGKEGEKKLNLTNDTVYVFVCFFFSRR